MAVPHWGVTILALTKEERLLLWVGILMSVLIAGGVLIARIDRWRKRQMEEMDETNDHVTSFRALYERGEITRAEYDRVLRRVAERVSGRNKPVPASAPLPPDEGPTATQEPPTSPPG